MSPARDSGRGYAAIGLCRPKTPENVGSVIRAAHVYRAAMVAVSPEQPRFGRTRTDTQKGYRHIPVLTVDDLHSVIPFDCVPVAVELVDGARSLVTYKHPERAFYVFGPEDGTLGRQVLDWCRDVVYIPTAHCMNLAACVNVVLYDRLVKGNPAPTSAEVVRPKSMEAKMSEVNGASVLRELARLMREAETTCDAYHGSSKSAAYANKASYFMGKRDAYRESARMVEAALERLTEKEAPR